MRQELKAAEEKDRAQPIDSEESRSEVHRKREQDRLRYAEFLEFFGPETQLYNWIFQRFHVTVADRADLTLLDQTCQRFAEDALFYHDESVQTQSSNLTFALDKLQESSVMHYYSGEGAEGIDRFRINASSSQKYDAAAIEIERLGDEVIDAWRAFVRAAHESGIDFESAKR